MFGWQFIDAGERELRRAPPIGAAPRSRPEKVRALTAIRREFFIGCWLAGGEPYAAPFFPGPRLHRRRPGDDPPT